MLPALDELLPQLVSGMYRYIAFHFVAQIYNHLLLLFIYLKQHYFGKEAAFQCHPVLKRYDRFYVPHEDQLAYSNFYLINEEHVHCRSFHIP
ncbi:hypothetical protein APHACPA_1014 [Rickettsia amblyommatis str. Ac/Pa]|uniref:Uncharacterized protein n=1 Tax=Rickettsia amblyommatis str. Ac/Pa TaxID=1359164 RepID=A0A0F3N2H9_RICAM|nr:hypothetical protein APHACPA_1014 [Rickettsia amblyommatis str. Ac/Pa]